MVLRAELVPLQRILQLQFSHSTLTQSHVSGHRLHPTYLQYLPKVQIFRELPRFTTAPAIPNSAGVSFMPDASTMAPIAAAQREVDIRSFAHPSIPVKFVPYNNAAIGDGGHDVPYVQPIIEQVVNRTQPVRYAGQYHNFQVGPGYMHPNPQNDVVPSSAGFSQPTSWSLLAPHLLKHQGNASAQASQLCTSQPIIANGPQQFVMPSSIPISQPLFPVLRPIVIPRSTGFFHAKYA